jgi:hypothetical protein
MLNGPKLIRAARRAVYRMTPDELAAVEREIARRPAKRLMAGHGSDEHDASSLCRYCVAETVEQFVLGIESETPHNGAYLTATAPGDGWKGRGRGGARKMACGAI